MKRWPWIVGGVVFIAVMFALNEGLWIVAKKWGAWPILLFIALCFIYALWTDWRGAKKRITALEDENESLRRSIQLGEAGNWSRNRSDQ